MRGIQHSIPFLSSLGPSALRSAISIFFNCISMSFKFKYCYWMSNSSKLPEDRIQIASKRKIALVCSGGATKAGAFHLGVALALQEHGFKFYGGTAPSSGTPRPPGPMEISTYVG